MKEEKGLKGRVMEGAAGDIKIEGASHRWAQGRMESRDTEERERSRGIH